MKTINILYENQLQFIEQYKHYTKQSDYSDCLVQVFTSILDKDKISNILQTIKETVANCTIIGSTTDGEIYDGKSYTNTTVVSITYFESTTIKSSYIDYSDFDQHDFLTFGSKIASDILTSTSKAAIIFADGITTNGEELIQGFSKNQENIIIAGGLAGDNGALKNTYVIHNQEILEYAVVAVSLNSESLVVNTQHSFDYRSIGQIFTVTKSIKNRVYEINGVSAKKLYAKYLGEEIASMLPQIGIEFPLILNRDNNKIARAALQAHDDESITFAGNIYNGESIQFGYGNIQNILNNSTSNIDKYENIPAQSIFIYSCMARRRLLGSQVDLEIDPYNCIAPTSGFFTYGEFYSYNKSNQLLNQTMTLLFLSEDSKQNIKRDINIKSPKASGINHTLTALSHLINITTSELNRSQSIENNIIYSETDLKGIITYISKPFEIISGYTKHELIGKPHNIVRHPDVPKEIFKDMWSTIKSGKSWNGVVKNLKKDGTFYVVKATVAPLFDENNNIVGYGSSREDITFETILKEKNDTIINLQDGIFIETDGKNITNINNEFFNEFGYKSLDEFKTHHNCICELFIPKANESHLMPSMDGLLWTDYILKYPNEIHKAYMFNKFGSEKIYTVHINTIQDNLEHYIISFKDVTKIVEQSKIIEKQKKLMANSEAISAISHQWRQPLNVLSLITSKMKFYHQNSLLSDDKIDKFITDSENTIDTLSDTIDQFKVLFLHLDNDIDAVILKDIINKAIKLKQTKLIEYNIKHHIEFNNNELEVIHTDIQKVANVLDTIYENAIESIVAEDDSKAVINTSVDIIDNHLYINIFNSGKLISDEILDKMFDSYFSTKDDNERGLGLYIAKIMVEHHLDGKLRVQNDSKGTTFTIQLNIKDNQYGN